MNKIMILAIGGAGGNIVVGIRENTKLKDVRYVFADCEENNLKNHTPSELILLDNDKAQFPDEIFDGIEKLVIVTGLGGETGTKYAELAAKTAIEAGIASVNVIATLPFVFEGDSHVQLATSAARRFTDVNGVNVTILNNEDLLAKYPNLNFLNAFKAADKEIMHIVGDIL